MSHAGPAVHCREDPVRLRRLIGYLRVVVLCLVVTVAYQELILQSQSARDGFRDGGFVTIKLVECGFVGRWVQPFAPPTVARVFAIRRSVTMDMDCDDLGRLIRGED